MYDVVIGYDRDNRMPAYTMAESVMQNSSVPVRFTFLHRDMLKEYTRPRSKLDSTDFSNSRFLVPYLFNYQGWTLYTDNDMIAKSDIRELFDMTDDRYTIMCVKHNQIIKNEKKFLNYGQYKYSYKNWSSVMLFNNERCRALTLDYVNTAAGLDLHQFRWIDDHSNIGDLPLEWNYLVENQNQTENEPKLIHYTDGGPYFIEHDDCEYSTEWKTIYEQINDVRSYK
jgi:lipopolysaccharide biosynthesis glycosyltransferase